MRNLSLYLLILLSACYLTGCKPKEAYQYDKYGMQRMTGAHTFHTYVRDSYHYNGVTRDSVYSLNDTSFVISVLDKDRVYIANTRLYIVDEYTTSTNVVFVNDTGSYCGPSCHKIVLYYNYNANTIDLTDGVYNINYAADVVTSYIAPGH